MSDKEVIKDVAETMYGESRDPNSGFTMNVIHHHHEHVVVSGGESQGQNIFDMMLNLKVMQSIMENFQTSGLLDSKSGKPILIESDAEKQSSASDIEYEIIDTSQVEPNEEDTNEHFTFIAPKFNPVFDGKKYYEIIQTLYFPAWKVILRDAKIETPFAIILLEPVEAIESVVGDRQKMYLALYGSTPVFSKAMYGKNAPKSQEIPRNWDHAPYFVETLRELEYLAKEHNQKFAYYVEEMDLEGKKRFDIIMSNDFPKTELTEHHSIFAYKPDVVYTNFERNIFKIEFNAESFRISRV